MSTSAPGELELVRAFVNTWDIEADRDSIETADDLARWLGEAGLLPDDLADGDPDVAWVRAVREALREALAANHDAAAIPDEALSTLNAAADRSGLSVAFGPDRRWRCTPSATGPEAAIGALLVVVVEAMVDGTWSRLKVCRNDGCRWAFYDHSRARSGKWCSMNVCGNRAKQSAWRERRASR